ncbi:inositol hexakisphosphate and diphosphoinositol-pentakisphosphate kinase [Polyrhizophydium stewartii]|uniref:Inositol hexakisphosphate and diphosphoinositol-pentakisphosphate kinase n=1 Tax=Polyrhizophydium stewartii TaxID=2732419 RepID=A0ABR4N0J5_9FUNG
MASPSLSTPLGPGVSVGDGTKNIGGSEKWIIGICALDTKARSKPMRNILNRLIAYGDFEAVVFGDKVILDEDIEHWPYCDFLISFFSNGFPLDKAIAYVRRYKPFCINDLPMQELLLDRRLVLAVLDAVGVPTPRRIVTYNSDIPPMPPEVVSRVRSLNLDLDGMSRKRSAAHLIDPDSLVADDCPGVVLKKPFVEKPVSGEDHNVYIYYDTQSGGGVRKLFRKVGNKSSEYFPDENDLRTDSSYVYEEFMSVDNAEDVKVYTIGEGYAHAETRKSPVVDGIVRRNAEGKEIRYITPLTPEERDIARRVSNAFGQTVCGFDLLRAGGRSFVIDVNGWSFVKGNTEYYDNCAQIIRETCLAEVKRRGPEDFKRQMKLVNQWRLKAYLSVMRHGDRTPKQKIKFTFKSQTFLDLLSGSEEEIVFKKTEQLKRVAEVVREAIKEGKEDPASLKQLEIILDAKAAVTGTKVQIKPGFSKEDGSLTKIQMVVKWGGVFTHGGLHQSRDLGENLRKDLMIINKRLLDYMQVYSSSEDRVKATAEIFCKSLLGQDALEPDFITVNKEMLDDSNAAKEQMDRVKARLQRILNPENPEPTPPEFAMPDASTKDMAPFVQEIVELLSLMRATMRENAKGGDIDKLQAVWCCSDSALLFLERWEKLFRDFVDVERAQFEPSKISELYDSLKYDLIHNRDFLHGIFASPKHGNDLVRRLYAASKVLFDIIGPHEYGIENNEKLDIGFKNAYHLLKHLYDDLEAARDSPTPSTCLYFTKESKIICLLNIVLLCGLKTKVGSPADIPELDYLTQISFELYERTGADASGSREYSLRVAFSPGAHDPNLIDLHLDRKHSLSVAPRRWISDHINLAEALQFLNPDHAHIDPASVSPTEVRILLLHRQSDATLGRGGSGGGAISFGSFYGALQSAVSTGELSAVVESVNLGLTTLEEMFMRFRDDEALRQESSL